MQKKIQAENTRLKNAMLSVKSAYPIQSMVKHANFNKKLEKNLNRKTWKNHIEMLMTNWLQGNYKAKFLIEALVCVIWNLIMINLVNFVLK